MTAVRSFRVPGAIALASLAFAGSGAPASGAAVSGATVVAGAGAIAPDTSDVRLYVPNQLGASISVLDGEGRLLETVDLRDFGYSEHAMPHQVAAAPDGSRWYVSLAGAGEIAVFDDRNRRVGRVAVEAPGMLVLDPTRGLLHVSRALMAVRPPSSLAVIRISDLSVVDEPEVFVSRPHALAVDTVSGRVYTGSLADGLLAVFDPATGEVRTEAVADAPSGFVGLAVSPDGSRLAATTQVNDRMLAFDASGSDGLEPRASIPVEAGPYDMTFSPDGRFVWFPNQQANAVTRVEATNWTVDRVLHHPAFVEPHGVIFTPDGGTVYVTSHGESVAGPEDGAESEGGAADPAGEVDESGDEGHVSMRARGNGTVVTIDAFTTDVRSVTEVGPYAAAPGIAARP